MRDAFGCVFSAPKQETNKANGSHDTNLKGMPVSSNGYYGYQPLPQTQTEEEKRVEYMEIQMSDAGIQFNNFIAPEDRLSGIAEGNVMRGPLYRKRRWSDDTPLAEFKKRRENDTEKKCTQATPKKHSVDDLVEQLLRETHGCSIYHWMSENMI